MARTEALTRRDSLYVVGISVASVFGAKTIVDAGLKSPHYLHYRKHRKIDSLDNGRNEFESFIYTSYDRNPFTVDYQGRDYAVIPERRVFSEALVEIANIEDTRRGKHRLRGFLRTSPLEIRMQDSVKKYLLEDGKEHEASATYTYSLVGGPTARFSRSYVAAYIRARKEGNLKQQVHNDQVVWHELYHFWQDMRNPYMHAAYSLNCAYLEMEYSKWSEKCDHEHNPIEIEAERKSNKIISSLRAGYISGKIEEWPFGHFFSIQQV